MFFIVIHVQEHFFDLDLSNNKNLESHGTKKQQPSIMLIFHEFNYELLMILGVHLKVVIIINVDMIIYFYFVHV